METPSSARRITRSQAAAQQSMQEESHPRTRNAGDRAALLDITNDSPVVGLAAGSLLVEKTPSSSAVKSQVRSRRTPGSGEEVLRGQVRTLLQKVEEEAEIVNKPPPPLFPALLGFSRSPAQLLAPTPANTPQIPSLNCLQGGGYVSMEVVSPCVLSEEVHRQVVEASDPEEPLGTQGCLINRALMFDSPEKSDMSGTSTVSSSLTYQCGGEQEKSPEDDNSSIWSMQVNASANTEADEDELVEDLEAEAEDINYEEAEEEEDEEEEDLLDGLCEGLKKMSMVSDKPRLPEFAGKHTRFVYNSDGEIEGEEEVKEKGALAVSPNVLVLKGLPVPEGRHLRFQEEDEED